MRYKCSKCQTEYFEPGECDWCPGVARTRVWEGPCEERFEKLLAHARKLEVKAAKWDVIQMACHRFGVRLKEVIEYVNQRVKEGGSK